MSTTPPHTHVLAPDPVPEPKTVGLAAKVTWPTVALLVCGVILMVLDLTGVADLKDELWLAILGSAGGTFGLGYSAPPTKTK